MSKLIEELKQEHKEITEILVNLKELSIYSIQGMDLLMQSKNKLLSHLSKEDKYLYPVLKEKSKTDLSLKRTLDVFGKEMDEITKFVLDFYERYSNNNDINKTEFSKDISAFIFALKNRIMKEEVAIYKAYDKIQINEFA
jgi:hemerythrin-like domain-containing protein